MQVSIPKKIYTMLSDYGPLYAIGRLRGHFKSRLVGTIAGHVRRALLLMACSIPSKIDPNIKVSIIIPVFNHSKYLRQCIDSALNQSYQNIEVIIIDDCSTDPVTHDILRSYADPRCRIIFNERNLGITQTTNKALVLASGDYVAFLDCDDMLAPNAIMRIVKEATRRPDIDLFFTDKMRIDSQDKPLLRDYYGLRIDLLGKPIFETLIEVMVASHLMVIKRSKLNEVGFLTDEFSGCQDYDIALRFAEFGKVMYLPGLEYFYRWHPDAVTSRDLNNQYKIAARVRDRAIARHYFRKLLSISQDNVVVSGSKGKIIVFLLPWLDRELSEYIGSLTAFDAEVHIITTLDRGRSTELDNMFETVVRLKPWWSEKKKIAEAAMRIAELQPYYVHIVDCAEGYAALPRIWELYPRPFIGATLSRTRPGFVSWIESYQSYIDVLLEEGQLGALKDSTVDPAKLLTSDRDGLLSVIEEHIQKKIAGLNPQISIVIRACNDDAQIAGCLESIVKSRISPCDLTISGSCGSSISDICLPLCVSKEPLWRAVANAKGDYILVLSANMRLRENTLEEIILSFEANPAIGAGVLHIVDNSMNFLLAGETASPDMWPGKLIEGLHFANSSQESLELYLAIAFKKQAIAGMGDANAIESVFSHLMDRAYKVSYMNSAVATAADFNASADETIRTYCGGDKK